MSRLKNFVFRASYFICRNPKVCKALINLMYILPFMNVMGIIKKIIAIEIKVMQLTFIPLSCICVIASIGYVVYDSMKNSDKANKIFSNIFDTDIDKL